MRDEKKTKQQLIRELEGLRHRLADFEGSLGKCAGSKRTPSGNEEALWALINATQETLILIGTTGKVILANEIVARRLRTTVQDLIGSCIYDHFPPELARSRREHYELVAATGKGIRSESVRAGRIYEDYCYPVFNEEGEITSLAIFAADITEQRQTEKALRESEEKYRSIFENAVEGIFQSTPDGRFLSANPALARMYGFERPEDLLAHITDIAKQMYVDPGDRARLKELYEKQGFVEGFEAEIRARNGDRLWVSMNARAVRDSSGAIAYYEGTCENTTKSKLAEAGLRKETEFNRSLIQASPAFFVALSPGGKTRLMNESMLHALGYTMDEVVGTDYLSLFVAEPDREMVSRAFQDLLESDGPTVSQSRVLTRDGRMLTVEWHSSKILDDHGGTDYFFGVGIDVTEQELTEQALRESESKFRNLVEKSTVGVYVVQDGVFKYLNSRCAEIFGYSVDELIDRKGLRDLVHPQDLPSVEENVRKRISGGEETLNLEFRIFTGDRVTRNVEVHGSRTTYEGGPALIGTLLDITERKEAERRLLESEERYRTAIEYSNDGVSLVSRGRHIYVNRKFLEIFGYDRPEDAVGKSIALTVHPDDRNMVMEYNRRRQTGTSAPSKYEFKGIRKNGETIIVEVSAAKTIYLGGPVILAYFRDITARKQLEERLEAMSIMDELTGLYNRRGFITLAQKQFKLAERAKKDMLLFFADLDHMKWINDTLGHNEGDKALADTARILKATFRESDLIGRMGGDEFAVLAIDASVEKGTTLLARLKGEFTALDKSHRRPYSLSLSVGMAHFDPARPLSLDDLLAAADMLMYEEKRKKYN